MGNLCERAMRQWPHAYFCSGSAHQAIVFQVEYELAYVCVVSFELQSCIRLCIERDDSAIGIPPCCELTIGGGTGGQRGVNGTGFELMLLGAHKPCFVGEISQRK